MSLTDKLPLQDHLLSATVLTHRVLPPNRYYDSWRPEQWAKAFPVLPTNALFKTIFWVKLLYQMDELCLPGDLNNECAEHRLSQCHWCMVFSRPSLKKCQIHSKLFLSPGGSVCKKVIVQKKPGVINNIQMQGISNIAVLLENGILMSMSCTGPFSVAIIRVSRQCPDVCRQSLDMSRYVSIWQC